MPADGQIAPCIQCGTQTIAREVHVNGKRQILAVCNGTMRRTGGPMFDAT